MEIFIDFGLFELLVATGIALVARKIYAKRWLGFGFLILSLLSPVLLVFFATEGLARWIAVVSLATALVNASLIFALVQRRDLAALLDKRPAPVGLAGTAAGERRVS